MEEDAGGGNDGVVTEFNTYEDFLDSQITPLDLYYLEVRMLFCCNKEISWFTKVSVCASLLPLFLVSK